ncbi:hypothetical protein QE152_g23565 [Popillia japonica]|uniref:Uncharacterized protein n=1 Tax=Popillia japonica TaxID=7064 RepID=A0AAW1KH37_POPJA
MLLLGFFSSRACKFGLFCDRVPKEVQIKDAIFGIALARNKVKPTTLQKSWRKLWPEAYGEETDSNPIENDAVVKLLDNVHHEIRNLPRDEVESWIDIDHYVPVVEEITDQMIVENVIENQQEFQPQDVETDEEEEGTNVLNTTAPPTWSEAAAVIDTFIRFAEFSKSYNATELINLRAFKEKV